ncbi:hypothetical protein C8R43DRAFT_1178184 [Mycena crocata]|nr:hypothetical protein C8R43DRAFT_1178184 [Mycena crocata]
MLSKLPLIVTSVLLTLAAALPEPQSTPTAAAQLIVGVPLGELTEALNIPLGNVIPPFDVVGTVESTTDGSIQVGEAVDVKFRLLLSGF